MQSVDSSWTAEEVDNVRKVVGNIQVSWKKDSLLANRQFTIGVSLVGGDDVVGINPGAIGSPGNYRYFDESQYLKGLSWERGLQIPLGGFSMALAEASLANESEPDYGQSLFLDGVDDSASFTRQTFSGEFTFAFWIKNTSASSTKFALADSSTDIKFGFANSRIFARVLSGGSSDNTTVSYTSSDWHHLVFTRDSNNKVDLYVDGGSAQRLFSDVAQSGNCFLAYVGRANVGGQFLSGYMDEVVIYDRKLSDSQISGLYNNRSVQSDVLIHYGFDGVATDNSSNGINATLNGGATYSNVVSYQFIVGKRSGRFTPGYMGGNSELFTAVLPRRPAILSAGFNYGGTDHLIPQFAGILNKNPQISMRNREVQLSMADYNDFFAGRDVDQTAIYTGVTSDVIMENVLLNQGMSTSQYDLDPGINPIPFAIIDKGTKLNDLFNKLAQAEYGHFLSDEQGRHMFRNRQWGDSDTYQRVIYTSQVINHEAPSEDHIINVVEIKSPIRQKAINQKLWDLASPVVVPANDTVEIFADFTDESGPLPVLSVDTPSYAAGGATTSAYATNVAQDNSGATNDSAISLTSFSQFATAYKMVFRNTSATPTFVTALQLWGRPAKKISDLYVRREREASTTAYEERPLLIDDNPFIQNTDWAESLAELLLEDFSDIDNIQRLTIRALPSMSLWDLVSWQGTSYRVFDIKTRLDSSEGFLQEVSLLKRNITRYWRIGIDTIGSDAAIAP